jgi:hypothetical protein
VARFELCNASELVCPLGVLGGGHFNKKWRKGSCMIWQVVIWVIWNARNGIIFNNENTNWEDLVEKVKVLTWRWLLSRGSTLACMFYEWCWCPKDCLLR